MKNDFFSIKRKIKLKIKEIFHDDKLTNWEQRENSKNLVINNDSFTEDEKKDFFIYIDDIYEKKIRNGIKPIK